VAQISLLKTNRPIFELCGFSGGSNGPIQAHSQVR
jgi:hypothetical protein